MCHITAVVLRWPYAALSTLMPPVCVYAVVCSKRLAKMISTMRERMSAKLGNNNDNAFKMRKLFKMYDKQDTGLVR
jgi:hypothetical protein